MKRVLRAWPQMVRATAMALAALALAWGVALGEGIAAAMVGAALGVLVGHWMGRSRLRLPVALGGAALVALLGWKGPALAAGTEFVPHLVGPAATLVLVGVLRFGLLAFAATALMRTLAARYRAATVLELGAITAAVTGVFSSHRDGIIARPLWLSDWAWQNGIDPANVLLGVGVAAVGLLAVLLVVENRARGSLSSLILLAFLGALAVLFINVVGAPSPQPLADLNLTNPPPGERPHDPPRVDGGHGGPSPNGADGGNAQNNQNQPDGGGDGGFGPAQDGGGDGGGGASGSDGGDDGGGAAGSDGGDGGGGAGNDAGDDGGGGAGNDGGDDAGLPPPELYDGGIGPAPPPQGDAGNRPPPRPSSEQLNSDQSPSNSPAPMAVMLLDDDYSPPSQSYYLRQEAWSEYNGSRLVPTTRPDADRDLLANFPTEETRVGDPPPTDGRARVHGTVVMLVEHTHPFALESPVSFAPAVNPNPQRFVRAYRFEALAQSIPYRRLFGHAAGDHRWSPELREYYLQGPTDPRYRELAERIVSRLSPERRRDPWAEAVAVKLYLDRELIYSTRERHSGATDPAGDCLFGNKTGYCVHFAHGAVYLFRALGIPARVGTGYDVDEDNRHGGSTVVVRAADAHAWPEIYLDGVGWVVIDIAAQRNLDPPHPAVDDDLQRLLGEMARNQPPNPYDPPRTKRGPKRNWGREIALKGLWALCFALLAMYAIKLWRFAVPAFAGARAAPRVAYRAALDRLAAVGQARNYGETREAFARRVAATSPAFTKLTDLHVAAKLGDPDRFGSDREERDPRAVRAALRAVRREVGAKTKWWRKVLGALNPASFLDAR